MPSRSATSRASSISRAEQQTFSLGTSSHSSLGHSLREMPTTSYPCCFRSAAATEESTPPLMATTTRSATGTFRRFDGEGVRRGREPPLPDIPRQLPHGVRGRLPQLGVPLDEPRRESVIEPEQVLRHHHLAVARRPGADPNGGNRQTRGDPLRHHLLHPLQHDRETPPLLHPHR